MTYAPRGFPKSAIDFIAENGPQFTGPLAEAIGCDAGSLSNILAAAVQNGALVRVRKPHMGHNVNFYSLGDGVPLERPKDSPLHDPAPAHECTRSHPHENMSPSCEAMANKERAKHRGSIVASAFGALPIHQVALPEPPTCTESQTAPTCEFAITNTGRLLIDTGSQQLALTKAQADQLMQYLDAQRGFEWEAA